MSEAQTGQDGRAARAFRAVMGVGLLLSLAVAAPGAMSTDSVTSLTEARAGVRQTWAPAVSSWVLKPFDALLSGTGLYVAASSAVLFLSLMALTRLRPRASWLAVILAALAILSPQLLIYPGIVWRDVLFANLTIAGFVLLARVARDWDDGPPLPALIGAAACLALGALARQNGLSSSPRPSPSSPGSRAGAAGGARSRGPAASPWASPRSCWSSAISRSPRGASPTFARTPRP